MEGRLFTVNLDGKKWNLRKGFIVGNTMIFISEMFTRDWAFQRSSIKWSKGIIKVEYGKLTEMVLENEENDEMNCILLKVVRLACIFLNSLPSRTS